MATKIEYLNNYDKFKEDFKKDTGSEWSPGSTAYTQYYHARIADMHHQATMQIANRLLNDLDNLPDRTGIRIGKQLRSF